MFKMSVQKIKFIIVVRKYVTPITYIKIQR